MILRTGKSVLLPVIALASWVGCDQSGNVSLPSGESTAPAADQPRTAPPSPEPLAALQAEDQHWVKFYGLPGSVLVVEELGANHRMLADPAVHATALDVYRALRPTGAIPTALQAAYDRSLLFVAPVSGAQDLGSRRASGGQPAAPITASASTATTSVIRQGQFYVIDEGFSSSNPAQFINTGYCDSASGSSICRVNWANGIHSGTNNTKNLQCIVNHYAGNGITVYVAEGSTLIPTFQAAGTTVAYVDFGSSFLNRFCQVADASGDSFHFSTRWF
jgi:hypothetical protein